MKAVPANKNKAEDKLLADVWKYTYRVFRGHLDTNNKNKFANPKDLVYLNGWLTDKQLVENGSGHINEAAVFASGGLQMVADYEIKESDLPHKFIDVAGGYWKEVLKPQMKKRNYNPQKSYCRDD